MNNSPDRRPLRI